jgi:2-C-methyl-D-erythritol 4-phosphate cytidylyltransferase
MIEKMSTSRALIPVVPVVDTLKSVVEGEAHPDRSSIVAVQTPQMFYSEDIKAAYQQAYDLSFTDDSSVAEKASLKIDTIQGEKLNIKITTKEDLELGNAILLMRKS